MSKIVVVILCTLIAGCDGASLLNVKTSAEVEPIFHPPLPAPVYPVYPAPEVLTPEITKAMNEKIARGEAAPYVFFGFDSQTWLSYGQYNTEVQAYLRYIMEIVKFYGHPDLQPKEKAAELKLDTKLGEEPVEEK